MTCKCTTILSVSFSKRLIKILFYLINNSENLFGSSDVVIKHDYLLTTFLLVLLNNPENLFHTMTSQISRCKIQANLFQFKSIQYYLRLSEPEKFFRIIFMPMKYKNRTLVREIYHTKDSYPRI